MKIICLNIEEKVRLQDRHKLVRSIALEQMANGNYDKPDTVFENMNIKELCRESADLITKIAKLHTVEKQKLTLF